MTASLALSASEKGPGGEVWLRAPKDLSPPTPPSASEGGDLYQLRRPPSLPTYHNPHIRLARPPPRPLAYTQSPPDRGPDMIRLTTSLAALIILAPVVIAQPQTPPPPK